MPSELNKQRVRESHKNRTAESYREKELRQERLLALMESDPEAFQTLLEKVAGKMLIPHSAGQREIISADERFLVLCAGRRWGKSKVGAARALREARKAQRSIAWVAPTYKVVKRGYEAVVEQIPDGLLTKPAPPSSGFDAGRALRLNFKSGSKMEFYSAERADGMLGAAFDFIILDEAATMPEHVWTQTIRPTLADRQGGALFISTPRGRNWFYYIWLKGQDSEEPDFRSWHFPSRENPTIPSAEFDQMIEEMPLAIYEQEVLAEFISEAASVFRLPTDDDENYTCLKEIVPPRGHVVLGVDLAKRSDFTVLCGVRATDRMPCYHDRFNQVSWPIQRQRIHDAVATILTTASSITILIDSGGPGDVVFDDLVEEGLDCIPINFTTWKERAVKLLASDLEQGRAFIHPDQLSEFEHYAYTITSGGRWRYEAARGHDDEVSAALLAHWGIVHEGVPDIHMLSVGSDATGDYEDFDDIVVDDGISTQRTVTLTPPSVAELMARDDVWD